MDASRAVALVAWLAVSTLEAADRDVRMAFLGDQGTADRAQAAVRDQLLLRAPRFVFLLGDNVYTDGQKENFGRAFSSVYRPVMLRGSEFHAALGNHDVRPCVITPVRPLPPDADAYQWRGRDCDVEHQLALPGMGYRARRRYYSVATDATDAPLAEVFVVDSNTLGVAGTMTPDGEDAAQLEWLDRALAMSRARWKVLTMHHPPHSPSAWGAVIGIGSGHEREARLAQQLQPLLARHRVDAVLAGHNHFYARMRPQGGVRYFVAGGGGRSVYGFTWAPGYVAAGGGFLHHVYVRLTDDRFEYYAIDEHGISRDAGWFGKGDGEDHVLPAGTLPPPPPSADAPPAPGSASEAPAVRP